VPSRRAPEASLEVGSLRKGGELEVSKVEMRNLGKTSGQVAGGRLAHKVKEVEVELVCPNASCMRSN
jgi:hypothetical protein